MKRVVLSISALLLCFASLSQSPQRMSYQAVIRDASDQLVTSQIGMQISILQGTVDGAVVYSETQTPTPNINGLVTIEVGGGIVVSGDFTTIDWSAGPYFIKTETDPAGGTNYTITGTSQLLSVPYALHAKTVASYTETQNLSDVISVNNSAYAQIKDVTDPIDPQDAATKAYVRLLADSLLLRIENIELSMGAGCGVVTFTYRGELVTYGTRTGQNGTCWMDRNLGASRIARAYNDSEAYGDLFQWGRLDDGHQDRSSSTTSVLSSTDDPGHADFIVITGLPYDWRDPRNDNLWQIDGGINDVCPAGWRLPTEIELDNERQSWSSNDIFGAYDNALKLPAAGIRASNGNVYGMEDNAFYWSNTINDNNARGLWVYDSGANISNGRRAEGASVRCIKDN